MKLLHFSLLFTLLLSSCVPKYKTPELMSKNGHLSTQGAIAEQQETQITYVSQAERLPSHLIITKNVHYRLSDKERHQAFTKELLISPLMHKASLVAVVQKNGKTIREYNAQKTSNTILTNNNLLTPGRLKLSVTVPFLNPEEEIVIKSSYNLMDIRCHWPIYMEEPEATKFSKVTIDVPYGISLRFKAADLGQPLELIPLSAAHENNMWKRYDNRLGQGTRFIFERDFGDQNTPKKPGARQQLFLAFDAPALLDKKTLFENWPAVASYLYSRIDRYDLPSNAIRDYIINQTHNKNSDIEKISTVLSFLSHDIEKRSFQESFQEQEVQPASRTFSRRAGSDFDRVVLGKAMLSSLGINADLVAVADPEQNPRIEDFFSPALFYKVILAIYTNAQTYYYDPNERDARFDQVPSKLQGQAALSLKDLASRYYMLPYESPDKNRLSYFYELSLNNTGTLEGTFSLNLTGIRADEAKQIINENTGTLSASALQNQLQSSKSSLRWQKAFYNAPTVSEQTLLETDSELGEELVQNDDEALGELVSVIISEEEVEENMNFTGEFSPRLLARGDNNSFVLPIEEIFESIFLPLLNPEHQRFSSISTVEAIIHVPANFKIAHDKPLNYLIDHNGQRARLLVTWEPGAVAFKGEVMLSLPFKPDDKNAFALPREQLTFVEVGSKPEAPREASSFNPPKDS